jgi:hypothetical protein
MHDADDTNKVIQICMPKKMMVPIKTQNVMPKELMIPIETFNKYTKEEKSYA